MAKALTERPCIMFGTSGIGGSPDLIQDAATFENLCQKSCPPDQIRGDDMTQP